MAIQIQLRRGTASQWTTANTLLAQGELGLETDTNKFKFGDGVTTWNSLAYYPTGTVTSVAATGGTGISITGSPITSSGTLNITNTAPDQTVVLTASTGISTSGTYPNFTITNSAPDQTVALTSGTGISTSGTYPNFTITNSGVTSAVAGTGISVSSGTGAVTITNSAPDQTVSLTASTGISTSGTYPNFTITNSAPDQTVVLTAGTGISTSGTYPNFTITNSAPDQTVSLTGAGTTSITGTYPNFTITSNDSATGTVTSVGLSGGTTGLTVTGSPITTSGTITLGGTLDVDNGGTGQTSYTDGQLLIGNTTGNTLTKSTLTAGSGIAITNGGGSISIAATNSGTVTAVTGTSPVVSSGGTTPAISLASGYGDTQNPYASKTANHVLAAPDGSAGVPTFRAVVAADIPTLNQNTTGTASNVTGIVAVANGGTGTATPSLVAGTNITISGSFPNQTINSTASGSGTVTSVAATVPSFLAVTGSPITTSGTLAITLSGTALPIANGGTGATTLAGASIATYAGTETLTNKRIDPRVTSAASASSLTPDISVSDVYAYTALAAGLTINAPTGTPLDGDKLIFRLLDNGTSRSLTWNGTYTVIGVTLPTATTISKTTYVGCIYNANNTRWDVIAVTTQA